MKYVLATLMMVAMSDALAAGAGGSPAVTRPSVQPQNIVRSTTAAETRLAELEVTQKAQTGKLDTDTRAADTALEAGQAKLDSLQRAVNSASSAYEGSKSGMWWWKAESPTLKKAYDDAVAAVNTQADIVKGLVASRAAVATTAAQIDQTAVDLEQTQASADANLRVLRAMVRQQGLLGSYDNLLHSFDNHDDRLNALENQIDQSIMGAYLQDKMAMLINSQSICDAYSRCKVGDPAKVPDDRIRSELFPTAKSVRSDSYDNLNKQNRRPAPMNRGGQAK